MKGEDIMSFWDTVLGHNLAETLMRTLPKIEKSLGAISGQSKRKQHASIVYKEQLQKFLNDEFENGRVIVNMTAIDNVDEHLARFIVVTE
jgi:hypothetical protein